MNIGKKNIMEGFLQRPIKRKMCYTCGRPQSHSLIYCKQCGDIFKGENLTVLNALCISHCRSLQKYSAVPYRPDYIAAIYERLLKDNNINRKEFEEYIILRIKEETGR